MGGSDNGSGIQICPSILALRHLTLHCFSRDRLLLINAEENMLVMHGIIGKIVETTLTWIMISIPMKGINLIQSLLMALW